MTTGTRMNFKIYSPLVESRSFPGLCLRVAVLLDLNVLSPGDPKDLTVQLRCTYRQ